MIGAGSIKHLLRNADDILKVFVPLLAMFVPLVRTIIARCSYHCVYALNCTKCLKSLCILLCSYHSLVPLAYIRYSPLVSLPIREIQKDRKCSWIDFEMKLICLNDQKIILIVR